MMLTMDELDELLTLTEAALRLDPSREDLARLRERLLDLLTE